MSRRRPLPSTLPRVPLRLRSDSNLPTPRPSRRGFRGPRARRTFLPWPLSVRRVRPRAPAGVPARSLALRLAGRFADPDLR